MKRKSELAKESPQVWLARIAAFRRMIEPLKTTRAKYAKHLSLSHSRSKGEHIVPLLFRYNQWIKAQAAGMDPFIEYPSDDGTPPEFAQYATTLIRKVYVSETCAMREWRDLMTNLTSFGSSSMWYGFHADVVDADEAQAAGESLAEAVEAMKKGDIEVKEGQDHALLEVVAEEQGTSQDAAVTLTGDEQINVLSGAMAQAEAREQEEREVKAPRVMRHRIWARREPIGVTCWSSDVSRWQDVWFMSREIRMPLEEARTAPSFRSSARRKLKGVDTKKHVEPHQQEPERNGDTDTKYVIVHEIWDKRTMRRHYVSPELPGEYLELNDANPFVDADGQPLIEDFYPCVVTAPVVPDTEDPERLCGIPLAQPGYDLSREYSEVRYLNITSARKHSVRMYGLHPQADTPEVREGLESGVDGLIISLPEGIDDARKAISPVSFVGTPVDLSVAENAIKGDFATAMAMPLAAIQGMAMADTATQEQIGVAAGNSQAEDIMVQIENDAAKGCEIIRALIRGFYPPEKIAAIMGPKGSEILEGWRGSFLDGDKLTFRFGARARQQEAVRVKQLMEAIQLAQSIPHPQVPSMPLLDVKPVLFDLFRTLTSQDPKEHEEAALFISQLVAQHQQQQQMRAEAEQTVAKQGMREQVQGETQGPSEANENSAAQRI